MQTVRVDGIFRGDIANATTATPWRAMRLDGDLNTRLVRVDGSSQ
jgi:hypothetical protein